MINVTVDVFSGRPNPQWMLDEREAEPVLKDVALHRAVMGNRERGFKGLGFRGIEIEFQGDDVARRYGLPSAFTIAHGGSDQESKAREIGGQIVDGMLKTQFASGGLAATAATPLDVSLQHFLQQQIVWTPQSSLTSADETGGDPSAAVLPLVTCYIETGNFNPGFWNGPDHIRRNNCYNYASNRRTNTFAQPGRASGHMYTALSCPAVSAAAISDGLHQRGDCFADSERPRWFMALVIAPGYDYHWYRKQTEGFWGHKPGGTAAINTDNRGAIVYDPRTADRGPYTQFCGFFYACRSQQIR